MADPSATPTLGVEEEYQITDPGTRELRSRAGRVVPMAQQSLGDEVTNELYLAQVEVGTPVCGTLGEVRTELKRLRRAVVAAAGRDGSRIAAAGTHPFSRWADQEMTPKDRYRDLTAAYQQHTRELVVFGCHVHVGLGDRELAIRVMNRARRWLPTILAISASSPFWEGVDTGFASYRTEVFGRFPLSGLPPSLRDRADYDAVLAELIGTGLIDDPSKIYWDMRPSSRFETLEFRIADVVPTIDEAVLLAGLYRGLAATCRAAAEADRPDPPVRPEILRAGKWLAARHGLDDHLLDFDTGRPAPADRVVEGLLARLRPALEDLGDWDEVRALATDLLAGGNGAQRQRAAHRGSGRFEDVVDLVVAETARGLE